MMKSEFMQIFMKSLLHLHYIAVWKNKFLSCATIHGNSNYCLSLGMPLLTANITDVAVGDFVCV
jgi:hypothetical protein